MRTRIDDGILGEIEEKVEAAGSGSVDVRDAQVRIGTDSNGEEALEIFLTLAAPDDDTWPVDDVLDTTRTVNEILSSYDFDVGWVIRIASDEPTEFDESEKTG